MFGNRFDAVGTYLLTSELNSLPVLLVLTSNPVARAKARTQAASACAGLDRAAQREAKIEVVRGLKCPKMMSFEAR